MPAALSPSRAADFKQCPLLYRFRVIDKLPEPPSPAAARGTLVHSVLERLFDLPAAERTVAAAKDLLPPQWAAMVEAEPMLAELIAGHTTQPNDQPPAPESERTDATPAARPTQVSAQESTENSPETSPEEPAAEPAQGPGDAAAQAAWFAQAAELVERWFTLEDPTRLEPAERELYVETDLDGLTLRGYVDRLDVAPGGELRVVDYKTGRSPSVLFEAKALFQMKFYALVLWRLRGTIPRMLQLVYLGNAEIVRYVPDEHDLRAMERQLKALWAAIELAAESGDWRPSTSRLCDWCSHRALCPAWGGTPPPLPEHAAQLALDPSRSGAEVPELV